MAQTGHLTRAPRAAAPWLSPVTRLRIVILLTILVHLGGGGGLGDPAARRGAVAS